MKKIVFLIRLIFSPYYLFCVTVAAFIAGIFLTDWNDERDIDFYKSFWVGQIKQYFMIKENNG